MSTAFVDVETTSPFTPAHTALDDLAQTELTRWSTDELLDSWRDLERVRNRLAAVEHRFIAEAERQGLPHEHAAKNTAAFLRGLLRVDPYDAAARVRAADAAAARVTLTGQPTPAPFTHVAAAQAAGTISPRHASVVLDAVHRLNDDLQAQHGERVEHDLVALAAQFDPAELNKLGLRMTTLLDQDGTLDNGKKRDKDRDLRVHQRPDGSSTIRGEATAALTERLLTLFDSLAKTKPEQDGVKDARTPGQRNHDALSDALDLLLRAEQLPDAGGVAATVVLTADKEDWESGQGVATTGHGAVLAIPDAIRLAGAAARIITVTLNAFGAITDWTDARRLFTECQRLAMIARDGGCVFPGCDAPPAWCQGAHIDDHTDGGPTTVANGMLLCGHHHRTYAKQGWRPIMLNGRPAWIPPRWIDPDQQPRRNHLHRRT